MITDKKGNELSEGNILFYSEMPHSNYADSICQIYNDDGVLKVETLIVNFDDEYIETGRDDGDLPLINYTWDIFCNPSDICENITKIDAGINEISIEYANQHFPLEPKG
jgi:hypothetical protein